MEGTLIIVAGICIAIYFFITQKSWLTDRQKAEEIIKKYQIPEMLEALHRDIRNDNYYGALNSVTGEENADYSLTTYSFIFSDTKVSLTLRYSQTSPYLGLHESLYLKMNNQLFIVLAYNKGDFMRVEEYHHDHQSLEILKKIFFDIEQNYKSRLAEERKCRELFEKEKFTFKRN
jgi:hypothetical protein